MDEIRPDGLLNSWVAFTDKSLDAACRKKPPSSGCKSQTTARYLPVDAAEKITKELELAWKDFQEAAYFHMNAQLNVALPTGLTGAFPNCLTGLGGGSGIKPRDTPVTTRVEESMIEKDLVKLLSSRLKGKLPIKPTDGVHWNFIGEHAESGLFPKIPTNTFCAGRVSPRFFPPDNTATVFPTAAYQSSHNENGVSIGPFPSPVFVNWAELANRMRIGCGNVWQDLYPKYIKRVAAAIAPLALTGATWNPGTSFETLVPGTKGPVTVQPVYESNPAKLPETAAKMAELVTSTLDPRAPLYYGMSGTFGGNITQAGKSGIASLETPKRFFPVLPLQSQTRAGVVNLLQIYPSIDIIREQRPLTLWTYATACAGIWPFYGCSLVPGPPVPAPETLMTGPTCVAAPSPGAGGFTMTVPRYHYQYVTVPEGYSVPDVTGDPMVLRN